MLISLGGLILTAAVGSKIADWSWEPMMDGSGTAVFMFVAGVALATVASLGVLAMVFGFARGGGK